MKAMLLAAGLGTRLKPWTDHHPKALAPVNGKSLLERNILYLQKFEITEVVINVHHFADQIIDAIQENKGWGSNVIISDETSEVLETGGGLKKAKKLLGDEEFLLMNVDILTDMDLNEFIGFHKNNEALVSLAVCERKSSRQFLFDSSLRLSGWQNNQTGEEKIRRTDIGNLKPLAFSGMHIIHPKLLDLETRTGKFSIVDSYLDLCAQELIFGYDHSGDLLLDVGKPEAILQAEKLFL
jgi:N-acetyl-alpha-D-muramate 1-phosphate uridylyltransferase